MIFCQRPHGNKVLSDDERVFIASGCDSERGAVLSVSEKVINGYRECCETSASSNCRCHSSCMEERGLNEHETTVPCTYL